MTHAEPLNTGMKPLTDINYIFIEQEYYKLPFSIISLTYQVVHPQSIGSMSLCLHQAVPHICNSPHIPSSYCWWWRLAGGRCGNAYQRAKAVHRRSPEPGGWPRGPSQGRGRCSSHLHAPGWCSPWCAGRHSGGLGRWKRGVRFGLRHHAQSHAHSHNSNTHLSHIRRWSCVPACCCWCTHNDPYGRPALLTPWHRPLRPPAPLPPACEPSPSATSACMGRQTLWRCHDTTAPASPSWELLCEARWGRWLARTTLEQRTYSVVDVCWTWMLFFKGCDCEVWLQIQAEGKKNTTTTMSRNDK